ncbi:MAG: Ig-like domain-containing protein [Eubacterium sp.]
MKKILRKCMTVMFIIALTVSTVTMPSTQTQAGTGTVSLNKTNIAIKKGKSYTLTLQNNTKKIKWSSGNKKIATVSSKGKVKAKKDGTVTITAKVGSKKYKCKVTVYSKTSTIKVGSGLKISKNKAKSWKTSNSKVLKITKKATGSATVKGMKEGTAYLSYKVGSTKTIRKITVEALTQDEKENAEIRKMANSSTPVYSEKLSNMVFNELNAFRKQNGLNELKTNNAFKNSAKYMALWNAKNGKYAWHCSGIALGMAFENYKLYTYDIIAKRCIYMFSTSSGHLSNMLNKEEEGGAGAIYLCNGYAWCVIELSSDMDGMGPDFSSYQDVVDLFGNP